MNVNTSKCGYLYYFANDAWHFYSNNRGHLILEVTKIKNYFLRRGSYEDKVIVRFNGGIAFVQRNVICSRM